MATKSSVSFTTDLTRLPHWTLFVTIQDVCALAYKYVCPAYRRVAKLCIILVTGLRLITSTEIS